jgi:DNA-binding CsgD family transcriptional regulator
MDPPPVDWAPVLEVIRRVGAVDNPDSFSGVALEALATVVPFDHGSFNEVDAEEGRAVYTNFPADMDTKGADVEAFPRLIGQNPILQYQRRTGDGSARRLSDFLSQDELHGLDLYRLVYAPLKVEFQVAVGLPAKSPLVVAFALNRMRCDFTDAEVGLLDALRPHLIQAYRNVRALGALRDIDGALAAVGQGVLVLAAGGGEGSTSPWARQALEEHFGAMEGGRLPLLVAAWIEEERCGVLADGRPRINRPLASVVKGRQLVARFIRGVPGRPDVIVLEERTPERAVAGLRRLGLTPREAEILWLLTQGESTSGIAARLAVAPGTLGKHLQHIYAKLGVANRPAAIASAFDALLSYR